VFASICCERVSRFSVAVDPFVVERETVVCFLLAAEPILSEVLDDGGVAGFYATVSTETQDVRAEGIKDRS
jgi:hypothetical protein